MRTPEAAAVRLTRSVLVIADISGYTRFIRHRAVSLVHAEAIVTELLESVIDRVRVPLTVNKFEGDAALLFAEVDDGDDAVRRVVGQVASFFDAFCTRLGEVRLSRRNCSCDACAGVDDLSLKALVHVGEVAIKQVRQFEELAGESVILIHRLLKNHVPSREYLLLTEPVLDALGGALPGFRSQHEEVDGLGPVTVWWAPADVATLSGLAAAPTPAPRAAERDRRPAVRDREFRNLPRHPAGPFALLRDRVAIAARRLFGRR